ncbi:MAG: outer membrane beta-barrel protein [Elusimicrobiaceae bacterium]|nr:outer membrane beta-barrel protein [Elusimicrobiaceae bacterium]
MKRILTIGLLVGIFVFPGVGQAQGIEGGQRLWSIYGGLGTALQKSGLEVDGKNLSWGNIGGELGLSYLYFPSEYFGMGIDLRYAGFQGSEHYDETPGWWYRYTFESDFEMHTLQLMAAGRINLNPGSSVRLYIPFGAGAVLSDGSMTYTWGREFYSYYDDTLYHEDCYENTERAADVSFGWYAGVGLEFDSNGKITWGLEARYNSFRYDYGRLAEDVRGALLGKDTEHSYISLVFKLNF